GRLHLERRPSRALLAVVLARWLGGLGLLGLDEQVVSGMEGAALVTRRDGQALRSRLPAAAVILRETRGQLLPFGGGALLPGGPVKLLLVDGEVRALIAADAASGADDRRARDSRWAVTL